MRSSSRTGSSASSAKLSIASTRVLTSHMTLRVVETGFDLDGDAADALGGVGRDAVDAVEIFDGFFDGNDDAFLDLLRRGVGIEDLMVTMSTEVSGKISFFSLPQV